MTRERERSLRIFPDGSNGEFNLPPELTTVIQKGKGCELWDTQGRRFIDFSMGWGSVLVGHAHPAVVEAVVSQAPDGSNFSYINNNELVLAEELVRISPACEKIRFCASGTEATMYCIRLARAYTRKPIILKFEGAYHGAHDVGATSLFPRHPLEFPIPSQTCYGVDERSLQNILVAPYNDDQTTRDIITRYCDQIAAVIVEPLHRCTPPRPGFLESLRNVTRQFDIPLIFDEVVTGFRLAYGGAQEYYGVIPDLVAYGKALGGGYPIGAYGGRQEIMDQTCESRMGQEGYVWSASTLGGNPVSTAAALAALSILSEEGVYNRLHAMGHSLREGMRKILAQLGITAQVIGDGPLAQVIFTDNEVRDYRTGQHKDPSFARNLMLGLFERGVFLNPMGTKLYLSIAHNASICDEFLDHFETTLKQIPS